MNRLGSIAVEKTDQPSIWEVINEKQHLMALSMCVCIGLVSAECQILLFLRGQVFLCAVWAQEVWGGPGLLQKDDCDEPTILKRFMALDKAEWKAIHGEISASADNPCVIAISANGVWHKDQEMVQSCMNAQVKSAYCLLSKGSL